MSKEEIFDKIAEIIHLVVYKRYSIDDATNNIIEELQKNQSDNWVSVERELPKAFTGVLCYIENQDHIAQAYYEDDNTWTEAYTSEQIEGITHWMKLPKTPKEIKLNACKDIMSKSVVSWNKPPNKTNN